MCVLVVEDELLIRMGLAVSLEEAGHEVLCAEHGQDAVTLASLNAGRFTAVVTDYHMPGSMTGVDLVTHLRQDYPGIPMFITTALTSAVSEEWRQRHNVNLVAKPYDPEQLVANIGQVLLA